MSYTWEEIHSIVVNRRDRNSPTIDEMISVRDRYNGDMVYPYLSPEETPVLPPLTPQLITEAVDRNAELAGSVIPTMSCPPLNPGKQTGVRSREYADTREGILKATYHKSRWNLLARKAYRHLFGYATFCMVVEPDFKKGFPVIKLRDPLTAYPDERTSEDFCDPYNVAFVYGKSADWIRATFPEAREHIQPEANSSETMWEMVEWIDEDDVVIGILGPRERQKFWQGTDNPMRWGRQLRRYPNRAGRVPAICPSRITLDRVSAQLAKITGIADLMTRMMALDVLAREKSIFPDRFLLGRTGMSPSIVGGEWKDGRTGEMNVVLDAEKIGAMTFAPDPSSTQMIDRLERNFRVSGGLVPQMGGESYGALRTGRGIDTLMGAAVDPRIQEMQEVMAAHLPYLNESIFETYKGYWPRKQYSMGCGWGGATRTVEFTPEVHIESTESIVGYAVAGSDAQGTTIMLGQLQGLGVMSKQTVRELHPYVPDATAEQARIDEETMEEAARQAILQQAVAGMMSPIELARIERARRTHAKGDIFDAIEIAQREMQELQATQAPPPQPGQVAAPETQMGLGGGAAQPAPEPSIGAPGEMDQLRELMNTISASSRRVQ